MTINPYYYNLGLDDGLAGKPAYTADVAPRFVEVYLRSYRIGRIRRTRLQAAFCKQQAEAWVTSASTTNSTN